MYIYILHIFVCLHLRFEPRVTSPVQKLSLGSAQDPHVLSIARRGGLSHRLKVLWCRGGSSHALSPLHVILFGHHETRRQIKIAHNYLIDSELDWCERVV